MLHPETELFRKTTLACANRFTGVEIRLWERKIAISLISLDTTTHTEDRFIVKLPSRLPRPSVGHDHGCTSGNLGGSLLPFSFEVETDID